MIHWEELDGDEGWVAYSEATSLSAHGMDEVSALAALLEAIEEWCMRTVEGGLSREIVK